MNYNILKTTEITSIFLTYIENGMRKKYPVKLRFMDLKECYFATPMPEKFVKPKKKTPVQIFAYTPDGVYSANVFITDSSTSLTEVMFTVDVPQKWNFKQLRASSRKFQPLLYNIKFDDGMELSGLTIDISLGGISFISEKRISSIYERLNCTITVELPSNLIINFPDKKLITSGKFARKQENYGEYSNKGTLYAYKFIKLSSEQNEILRNYLLSLD